MQEFTGRTAVVTGGASGMRPWVFAPRPCWQAVCQMVESNRFRRD